MSIRIRENVKDTMRPLYYNSKSKVIHKLYTRILTKKIFVYSMKISKNEKTVIVYIVIKIIKKILFFLHELSQKISVSIWLQIIQVL